MLAIRISTPGDRDVMRLEELPTPAPGPGAVLVRIEAVGVNFVDVYERAGLYPRPLPFTPGSEAAGVVEQLGPGVQEVAVGDRVAYCSVPGAYATHAVVPAERLVPLPDGISTRQAAAAMLQGLTAHYLATSTYALSSADTCLIHAAAGGVGQLFCQIARRRGARVIGTVSTARKEELARAAGAHEVIRYTEQDFAAETRRLTHGRGVQVVYDSVGRTTFDASLTCLMPRGMLVLFGQSSGPVPPLDPQRLNRGGSLYLTRPTLAHYTATRDELLSRARELLGWIAAGELRLRVDAELPLANAAEAHRRLEERETTGKILLIP
ncbi:MAG TPA: quinone oxidoreductase [Gemmatimonadaceae bacterium]|nr:quinone oxidoreductase [Gemmatimonadaceae bacterium]